MITTNLRIAYRHLLKNKTFGFINLFGLAFGLAAAMAVLLYVRDELSFDAFHERADRIARVNVYAEFEGTPFRLGAAPNAVAPFIRREIPEVERAVRVFPHNFGVTAFLRVGDENFAEPHLYWADPDIFDVFSLQLQSGRPADALARKNTVVLSQSAARRMFGDADPVGKTLRVDNRYDLEITGVFTDLPANTHLPMEVVGSFATIPFGQPEHESWGNASFPTYLLLRPGQDLAALEEKIAAAFARSVPEDNRWFSMEMKPLLDIHLHSSDLTIIDNAGYGDLRQVRILIGLAIILLLIACINYMNLATARSQQRAKEVAVSKTMGASAGRLARQFYLETALMALAGIVLSIAILSLLLPFFNNLSGKQLTMAFLAQPWFWAGAAAIWLMVTLVAGAYPAAYLSSFTPLDALRQNFRAGSGAGLVRQGLVVFQFGISTVLIVSTLVFFQQLNFIRNKKLGYNPEQVVAVRVTGAENQQQVETLEKECRQLSAVAATALTQTFPGKGGSGRSLRRPNAGNDDEGAQLATCRASPDVFTVLDIPFLAGKPMRQRADGDTISQVVLNRSAVEYLGWTPEEAIGQRVDADLSTAEIAGVVEDFHAGSLHQKIGYYAFHNANSEQLEYLLVRLRADRLTDAMQQLKNTFERVIPSSAFDYTFLDDQLASLYDSERRLARVVLVFASLAIFVACLGLFALVAFTVEQRTKEIGLRKVLGASAQHIVALMSRSFLLLVVISIVLAVPAAWYAMNRWLQTFAYHVKLQWWVFALAGTLAVFIALLTVGYTSLRAALANPVEALRDE